MKVFALFHIFQAPCVKRKPIGMNDESIDVFHVVLTTHNSRNSHRMMRYKPVKGPSLELNLEQEICLLKIFARVFKKYQISCHAINVCKDHVHLMIESESMLLTEKIKLIKSISAIEMRKKHIGHPLVEKHKVFWSQKYYAKAMDVWQVNILESENNVYHRTLQYIEKNREKHGLAKSREMESIIDSIVKPIKD